MAVEARFGSIGVALPGDPPPDCWGEGWVGALSVMLFGIFAAFTLQRTGSLWFAIGFHAATDYAETFIYSVPDSGMLASSHLLNSSLADRWNRRSGGQRLCLRSDCGDVGAF